MPPKDANAIAILDSVTVSIAAEQKGKFKLMFLVNFDLRETSFGRTSECIGNTNTSSKVNASVRTFSII